jgi:transposase-like protein
MTRRRYTTKEKLSAVLAADMVGLNAAAKQTGIAKQTIDYWMDRPEFGQFRTKAREDMAEEIKVVAHLAWQMAAEALRSGRMEPRDILFAAEKATNLQLLMTGEATSRTETRSLTDDLDDHEAEVLGELIREELERRADGDAESLSVARLAAQGSEATQG